MDDKAQSDTADTQALVRSIAKCYQYVESDPEACLTYARKAAETICRYLFAASIANPGKTKFDEMIGQLHRRGQLPSKLVQPLVTVQKYGNYAAHPQDDNDAISSEYTIPCVAALTQITKWFFEEYLKTAIPPTIEKLSRGVQHHTRGRQSSVAITTVHELLGLGWDMERIIRDTMQIDYDTLPGLVPEHEGQHEQWVSVVRDHPETVRLAIDPFEKIVGYWHIIPLFPNEFKKMKRGQLLTTDITSRMICILELPGTYDIYFLILTVLTEYRRTRVVRALFDSFLDTLEAFAESGIFFREICIDAYTDMGEAICKSFGMKLAGTHPDRGRIYTGKCFPFPKHGLFSERSNLIRLYSGHFS